MLLTTHNILNLKGRSKCSSEAVKSNFFIPNKIPIFIHDKHTFNRKKKIALISISPFNGYFTAKNIKFLFEWGKECFEDFYVFSMDEASKYNLEALGYDERTAFIKTRKQDRNLYNKIYKALNEMGFNEIEATSRILKMSDTYKNHQYNSVKKKCYELYKKNINFKNDCLETTKTFLFEKKGCFSKESSEIAVQYLLDELPIWINASKIYNIPSLVLVYKDLPPSLYRIIYSYNILDAVQEITIKNIESNYEKTYPLQKCYSIKRCN